MSISLELEAPAKVNLGLRIVGRRADGYHELESLFAPIDLADAIALRGRVRARRGGGARARGRRRRRAARRRQPRRARGARVPRAERDRRARGDPPHQAHARGGGARRRIERRGRGAARPRAGVPRGAPGRGARGDRARARRRRAVLPRPAPGLGDRDRRAARARAPACRRSRSCSRIRASRSPPREVFRAFDALARARPRHARPPPRSLARELADDRALAARLHNDLEEPAVRLCPPIARLRAQLSAAGARAVAMSGSGATVYGVFGSRAAAEAAAAGDFASGPGLDPGRGDRRIQISWRRSGEPGTPVAPRSPTGALLPCWGVAKLVRQRPLEPPSAGSSPAAPAPSFDPRPPPVPMRPRA